MSQPSAVYLREYEELFTGSNQQFGHLTPFLSFESDTTVQTFTTDQITYFHYSETAETIPLSSIGIIEAGAVAGVTPYQSDKIWKKNANYKKYIWWGDSTKPQRGIWLCAWLSGNTVTTDAVWIDRFYNPGSINNLSAAFVSNNPAVYDRPSIMTFEPGVWYRYFHVGNKLNTSIVNSFSGVNNSLKLHINDWDYPLTDQSPYNNICTVVEYNSATFATQSVNKQIEDSSIYLKYPTEARVQFSDIFEINNDITVSFWAKALDWSNIPGHSLMSHNHRGGWDVYFNNGFYNPTFIVYNSTGKMIQGNSNLNTLFTIYLPGTSYPIGSIIDNNLYTWILDNGLYNSKKHLYKIDIDGNIDLAIDIPINTELSDCKLGDDKIWILDTNTNSISSIKDGTIQDRQKGIAVKMYNEYSLNPSVSNYIFGRTFDNINIQTKNTNYSTIWSAELHAPLSGSYEFKLFNNDYGEYYIDSTILSADSTMGDTVCSVSLLSGVHSLLIKTIQTTLSGYTHLTWKKPGDATYQELTNYIYPSGNSFKLLDIDLNSNVYAFYCDDVLHDNDNINWFINTSGIWMYGDYLQPILSGYNFNSIACDKDNNIWAITNDNQLFKINKTDNSILSGVLNVPYVLNNICLTNEYDSSTNLYKDYIWFTTKNDKRIYKYNTSMQLQEMGNLSKFQLIPFNRSMTSYDWNRKFNYMALSGEPHIQTKVFFGTTKEPICGEQILKFPVSGLKDNDWHHFTFTYKYSTGRYSFYVDAIERDTLIMSPSTQIFYNHENDIFIGADSGVINSLDSELLLDKLHFNGYIDDLRIYDYPLLSNDLWHIMMTKYNYQDLIWNMPTGLQNYIEEIQRFFKYKLPGSKSQYYNIRLIGLNITNKIVRQVIEDIIKRTVTKIAPLYTELYKITWE